MLPELTEADVTSNALHGVFHAVEIDAYLLGTSFPAVSTTDVDRDGVGTGGNTSVGAGGEPVALSPVQLLQRNNMLQSPTSPTARATSVRLAAGGGFSAVLLPKAGCDAVVLLDPPAVPTISASGSNLTTLSLSVFAPWQQHTKQSSAAVTVTISGPGLVFNTSRLTLPGAVSVSAVKPPPKKPQPVKPVYFLLTIEGVGVLPTRRWVKAV
jgi:hypothetical protein